MELFGLKARPELNGRRATVQGWCEASGRFNVQLDPPSASTSTSASTSSAAEVLALKEDNLRRPSASAAAPPSTEGAAGAPRAEAAGSEEGAAEDGAGPEEGSEEEAEEEEEGDEEEEKADLPPQPNEHGFVSLPPPFVHLAPLTFSTPASCVVSPNLPALYRPTRTHAHPPLPPTCHSLTPFRLSHPSQGSTRA